jgi:hypothetical protein
MDLQQLLKNGEKVGNVIAAIMSDETAQDAKDLRDVIKQAIRIVLDLLREPMNATRDIDELTERARTELENL